MLKNWLLAARPKTLLAGIAPVAVGASLAAMDDGFHALAVIAAFAGAMCIQIGTNFANDYFDFKQGADTNDRKGPTRAVQAGLISPRAMLVATFVMFASLALICVYLVARAGWPIIVIGILSALFGVMYTAGRYSLAYLGIADVFVLVFFGPVAVAGTYYVQTLTMKPSIIVAGFATGLLSMALLVVNNLRDIDEDAVAKKRTLAVRFGATFVRWEYTICVVAAAAIPVVLWMCFGMQISVLLAAVVIVPGSILIRKVWQTNGVALNPVLGMTAGLLLLYAALFCVGSMM